MRHYIGPNLDPPDDEIPQPNKGDLVVLRDGSKALVLDVCDPADDQPQWSIDAGDTECGIADLLLGVHNENKPRAISFGDDNLLGPWEGERQVLCHPDLDNCHAVGFDCDSTGVVYFDAECYGGQWYCTTTWDGNNTTMYLTVDDGPYETEHKALRACAGAGLDLIYEQLVFDGELSADKEVSECLEKQGAEWFGNP